MSDGGRTTDVEIFGERYSLRAGEGPEYLHRVAEYVDQKFREVAKESPTLIPSKIAVLASLNIADELFKRQEAGDRFAATILARLDGLNALLEPPGETPRA
ncbi:MAG: cell division protein ZapA [Candidatus Methylomirabilota bacterium]